MMTSQQAQALKYGDKVSYHGTLAIVQRVARNGVTISYDGKGIKRGLYVTERVSAAYLERAH
jgi:hypothetical protein